MRLCVWRALLPLLLVGACSFPDYVFAPTGGAEQPSTCDDGVQGPNETGIDCGGVCKACESTAPLPVCSDGERGEFETGVDCGGPCPGCAAYQDCLTGDDCESGNCELAVCQPPSCSDGLKNGSESDPDCGGRCPLCAPSAQCNTEADCQSGVCTTSKCQKPACSDHVSNGSETGVDCGGTCSPCTVGMPCSVAADCVSKSCDATQSQCVAEGCQDQVKNGKETDQDCGGGACAPCVATQACLQNSDCDSSLCNESSKRCVTASCSDSVVNQDESDNDCGGAKCAHCVNGSKCRNASDCVSGVCQTKYCVPPMATGVALDESGWVVTASNTFGDSSTADMIDGDPQNRWTSGKSQTVGMFVQIDMKKPQIFFAVTVDSRDWPSDAGRGYNVFVSNDGTFNSDPKYFSGGKAYQALTFETAVVARYVMIQLTLPGTEWWSIGELTVTQ